MFVISASLGQNRKSSLVPSKEKGCVAPCSLPSSSLARTWMWWSPSLKLTGSQGSTQSGVFVHDAFCQPWSSIWTWTSWMGDKENTRTLKVREIRFWTFTKNWLEDFFPSIRLSDIQLPILVYFQTFQTRLNSAVARVFSNFHRVLHFAAKFMVKKDDDLI